MFFIFSIAVALVILSTLWGYKELQILKSRRKTKIAIYISITIIIINYFFYQLWNFWGLNIISYIIIVLAFDVFFAWLWLLISDVILAIKATDDSEND